MAIFKILMRFSDFKNVAHTLFVKILGNFWELLGENCSQCSSGLRSSSVFSGESGNSFRLCLVCTEITISAL
jgi:hypothetical protein